MNLEISSYKFAIYIFLACLLIWYLFVRLMHSGPIKLGEHGTVKYIVTILLIIALSVASTVAICFAFGIDINFFKYLGF